MVVAKLGFSPSSEGECGGVIDEGLHRITSRHDQGIHHEKQAAGL